MVCGKELRLTAGQSEIDLLKNLLVSFRAVPCRSSW